MLLSSLSTSKRLAVAVTVLCTAFAALAGTAFARKAYTLNTATSTTTTAATTTTATATAPLTVPTGLFAASSFWNAPLAANAPLDAKSATYVAKLKDLRTRFTSWINTTANSAPVYRVPADQPLVKVTLDKTTTDAQTTALRNEFAAGVPIPATALAGGGVDKNLTIYQASTDTYWELWVATLQADGWHARWGGKLNNISTSEGRYVDPNPRWGSSATSLPLVGGLMTIDEVFKGSIDHALAIALPETRKDVYSWPAQRTDGLTDDVNAIPEGTRFRIPASVNLDAISMPPLTRMMAKAAQKYGIVVRDKSGSVAFYGEDPVTLSGNLWNTAFGGLSPSQLLASFPWDKLQALQTQLAVDPF